MKKLFTFATVIVLSISSVGCGDNIVEPEPAGPEVSPIGPAGPTGQQGPAGPEGPRGPIGLRGANGKDGEQGRDGELGSPGYDGLDGAPGAPGPAGPAGPPGLQGAQGPQGLQGPQGPAGADGADGANAVSAGNLVAGDAENPSVTFDVPVGTTMNAWLHYNVVGGGTNEVFDTWDGVAQGSCAKGTNQVSCDRVKLLTAGSHTISVTNSGSVDRATLIVLGL